jgi:hypothetical protein
MICTQTIHTHGALPSHTRAHHEPSIPRIFHRLRTSVWRGGSGGRWAWWSVVGWPEVGIKFVIGHLEVGSANNLRDASRRDISFALPFLNRLTAYFAQAR